MKTMIILIYQIHPPNLWNRKIVHKSVARGGGLGRQETRKDRLHALQIWVFEQENVSEPPQKRLQAA